MAYFHTTVLDNQIKALPTVATASGSVATFDTDMTENLVEVKCQIVAQQASGTPSPDNPLPITTYSEMNMFATGKNLIDQTKYYQLNANIVVIGQTVSNANRLVYLRQGTYTIKVETSNQATIYYDYGNGSTSLGNTSDKRTFTLANDSYCAFWLYKSGGYSPSDITTIQLEQGNEATTYEAYNGTTANIPFGQPVAKGTLNVTTGVLEITKAMSLIIGLSWNYDSANSRFNTQDLQGIIENAQSTTTPLDGLTCECYANDVSSSSRQIDLSIAVNTSGIMVLKDTNYNDVTSLLSAVGNYKIVYPLATPLTIQLSATQITALLNENNIWCDTNGNTSVKYLLTVGKAIS